MKAGRLGMRRPAGFAGAASSRRRSCGIVDYCPWRALIISSICFLTASRLKEAGSCIGG